MALLGTNYSRFDEGDVQMMKNMMKRFHELHKGSGMPDFSQNYVAYLPIFAIALLASQEAVDKLSRKLRGLTWIIAGLTVLLAILTVVTLIIRLA